MESIRLNNGWISMTACSVEGCGRANYAKGLCAMHYQRRRITGTTGDSGKGRASLEERFKRYVPVCREDECWGCSGARTGKGYGAIQEGGKKSPMILAHRLSYELHNGPIPNGMVVMHSCDNPPCVNPMHLRVGTQSENIIEAFIKGRKFTPQQLARMRANSE